MVTKKHLQIAGVSMFLIVKILLIISVIYLAQTLIDIKYELKEDINKTNTELRTKIIENQQLTQAQINELRDSLISTENSLTNEISEIKATASADFSGIIAEVIQGVVSVGTDVSQGSGFIIDEEGYIITNAHVLSDARYVAVLPYESQAWIPAKLIGYNEDRDIAILKITGNYEALEFGDSADMQVGEKVIALGNPLGLSFSVTEGIISALNREGINGRPEYIQMDTPLNQGNSGGPLVNKKGKVVGINNFKIISGENLGFALEANSAINVINNIFAEKNITVSV